MNGDFPRWGDYPEKLNLTYIASLITHGSYFDDRLLDVMSRDAGDLADARNFCPEFARQKTKFEYLVRNKGREETFFADRGV